MTAAIRNFYKKISGNHKLAGAAIIIAALLVRLGYLVLHPYLSRDGLYYLDVITQGAANSRFYDIPPCFSAIMRCALYAGIPLKYFGTGFNVICGALLPYVGYRIALKLKAEPDLAAGIGIFLVFFPPLVKNSADFLREPLFLLLGFSAISTALHQINRKRDYLWLLLAGVFAAGSISVRVEGFEFVLLILIMQLLCPAGNLPHKYAGLLIFAAGCLLPLLATLTLQNSSGSGYGFLTRRITYYQREILK